MLTGGGKDRKVFFLIIFLKNLEAEVITGTTLPSIQFSLDLQSPSKLTPLRTTELKATCTKIQVHTKQA